MEFPAHKGELVLTHNEHRNYYDTAEKFIFERELADDFESHEEMRRAIEADSIWVLQWYPDTPNGFYRVAAATLDGVLSRAKNISDRLSHAPIA